MKRKSSPEKIGSIVENILSQHGYLNKCKEENIVFKWSELVGNDIAQVTECTRTENGILYVKVHSASWRQELSYMKQTILKKIWPHCRTIKDIRFY